MYVTLQPQCHSFIWLLSTVQDTQNQPLNPQNLIFVNSPIKKTIGLNSDLQELSNDLKNFLKFQLFETIDLILNPEQECLDKETHPDMTLKLGMSLRLNNGLDVITVAQKTAQVFACF